MRPGLSLNQVPLANNCTGSGNQIKGSGLANASFKTSYQHELDKDNYKHKYLNCYKDDGGRFFC